MKSVTIELTEEQHRRLVAAAAFVGRDTTIEELITANALSRLDGFEIPANEARCDLRHGVLVYAREKLAAAGDLSAHEVNIGLEVCDHELATAAAPALQPWRISFEVDPELAADLREVLAKVEVPESAIASLAIEQLWSLADSSDHGMYIAEGYVYPDRATARRVADRLLAIFFGRSEVQLKFCEDGEEVYDDFPRLQEVSRP